MGAVASTAVVTAGTAAVVYLVHETHFPRPTLIAFLLGAIGSQTQMSMVVGHAASLLLWWPQTRTSPALHYYGLGLGAVAVFSWAVMARDFVARLQPLAGFPKRPCSWGEAVERSVLMLMPFSCFLLEHLLCTVHRDILYNPDSGCCIDVVSSASAPAADPAAGGGKPVLLFLHGGAWMFGNKRYSGRWFVTQMARAGFVVVTASYSLSRESKGNAVWPAHILDVKRAIVWVKHNAAAYGGDPSFIAISGQSAGGHLACLAALTPNLPRFQPGCEAEDTSVQACISQYGISDMADLTTAWKAHEVEYHRRCPDTDQRHSLLVRFLQKSIFKVQMDADPELYRMASPLHHVLEAELQARRAGSSRVAFLVAHGTMDTIVPVADSELFHKALKETGHDSRLAIVPGGHHGFNALPNPQGYAFFDAVCVWLRSQRAAACTP